MKETKNEKGITLVTLIITILILLILSVIAISTIQNTKIAKYVADAAEEYNSKKSEEQTILSIYDLNIENYNSSTCSFTLRNTTTGETKTYKFIQGQTWQQYVLTCSDFYIPKNSNYVCYSLVATSIKSIGFKGWAVRITDEIVDGGTYTINETTSPMFPL